MSVIVQRHGDIGMSHDVLQVFGVHPSVGEAGEAETAGPVQAAETAEESGGAGGVAIAFVVLALAGGAILWLMLRRDKNTRG